MTGGVDSPSPDPSGGEEPWARSLDGGRVPCSQVADASTEVIARGEVPARAALSTRDAVGLVPEILQRWAERLLDLGWDTYLAPAAPAWPKAILTAEDPAGAAIYIRSSWKVAHVSTAISFPARKRSYWCRPRPDGQLRAPWCRLSSSETERFVHSVGIPALIAELLADKTLHGTLPRVEAGCACGKVAFTQAAAEEALAEANLRRTQGSTRRRERRVYQCDRDALKFHLTSQR